jgi:hypothetical protein
MANLHSGNSIACAWCMVHGAWCMVHKSSGNSSSQLQLTKKQNPQHSTTSFVKNWIHEGTRGESFQNITNTVT